MWQHVKEDHGFCYTQRQGLTRGCDEYSLVPANCAIIMQQDRVCYVYGRCFRGIPKMLLCLTGLPFYLNGNLINMKLPACGLLKVRGKLNMPLRLNRLIPSRNLVISPTAYLLKLMAGFIVGKAATRVVFISGSI